MRFYSMELSELRFLFLGKVGQDPKNPPPECQPKSVVWTPIERINGCQTVPVARRR